jgi:hypothetical protein
MFNTDNEIYQHIVNVLCNCVQENWIEIKFHIDRTSSNHIGLSQANYFDENYDRKDLDGWCILDNTTKAFEALYQIMTAETDKHKWNRLVVTLIKDGDLNVKFEWDQELADEIEKASKEYDPRWDDTLTLEERDKKYKEMVANGELLDYSKINIKMEK